MSPRRTARTTTATPEYRTILRTSERASLNRCRQRWDWGYGQRLRPRREAPALRFGTLIHRALEHYWSPRNQARNKPIHPAKSFLRFFDQELEATMKDWPRWKDENDEWYEYRELGAVMLKGYLEEFRERDREYIVLAVEQRFQMPIIVPRGEPALEPPSPTQYVGTFDRILFHMPSRRLLFGDYKTTKTDPTKVRHLGLDEQAGSYWAYGPHWVEHAAPIELRKHIVDSVKHLPPAYRKAVNEWRFDGILYDFLKKDVPDDRPKNAQGHALNKPTKAALVEYANQNKIPTKGLKVDELISAIDIALGQGTAVQLGEISERQQGPLFHRELVFRDDGDKQNVLRRIYQDAVEIGKMRRGEMFVKKSPDRFICIGCQFIDMCELHETGADWEALKESEYEDWDPYTQYAIDEDELE